jgi:uncharacterized protein
VKRSIAIILTLAFFATCLAPQGTFAPLAGAQQKTQGELIPPPKRPNLLQMLFGGGMRKQNRGALREPGLFRKKERPPKTQRVIVAPKPKGQASTATAGTQQPVPKTIIVKSENAAKILVTGDFMADSLHWGLEQAYSSNPDAVFVNKASGLSGMVRDDVVNWPEALGPMIDEVKPVAVVMLVGMNDRQQMRLESGRVPKLSEPWKAEYDRRVEAAVNAARTRNVPLVWLGLPPVKSGAMNTDYLVLNEVYRAKVEAAGGRFVDVWDGFTNAEGQFVSAGPDINGQIVRLRNADGINMTRAGMSKLAFYAERELRKLIGLGAETAVASLSPDGSLAVPEPEYDPAKTGRTIVIGLDSPQADGGDVLEGAEGFLNEKTAQDSMSFALVAKGTAYQPKPGRIDAGWGMAQPALGDADAASRAAILAQPPQFTPDKKPTFIENITQPQPQ